MFKLLNISAQYDLLLRLIYVKYKVNMKNKTAFVL